MEAIIARASAQSNCGAEAEAYWKACVACVDGPRASRAVDDNLMQRVACGHVSGLLCGQHDRWP